VPSRQVDSGHHKITLRLSVTGKLARNGGVGSHSQVLGESSANLTLPDCVRVARFYRELSFAANQGLGE